MKTLALLLVTGICAFGCVSSAPDVTEINRPGTWRLSFTKLIDQPDYSVTHEPAPNFPDRVVHLPDAVDICAPGCTCDYTKPYFEEGDIDSRDRVWADLVETCPAANHVFDCHQIEFTEEDHGWGVCVDNKIGHQWGDPSLGRYDITFTRVS
jgi:hypothetical protein